MRTLAAIVCLAMLLSFTANASAKVVKQKYAGLSRCKACHKAMHGKVWKKWKKGFHAKAFDKMLKKSGGKFSGCLMCHPKSNKKVWRKGKVVCFRCHTTGYGYGGFDPDKKSTFAEFAGVGCEGCHGPMASHATNPMDPRFKRRKPRCYKCHFRTPKSGPHAHKDRLHGRK